MNVRAEADTRKPLVVDLDGSLLRSDTLHELLAVALTRPRVLFGAVVRLATRGRAALKNYLAANVTLDVETLPANSDIAKFVASERQSGRRVYLATGADFTIANLVRERFTEFDGAFASDGHTNLTGTRKAELLVGEFGANGFDYIGDSRKDVAVWRQSDRSYLVTSRREGHYPRWSREFSFEGYFGEQSPSPVRNWARELRVHQSLKNLLLFLPLLAAHDLKDFRSIGLLVAGFVSFSLMASAVYLLNDLVDLRSDRLHQRKSLRPIADGRILPMRALTAAVVLALLGLSSAVVIGVNFAIVLGSYAIITCAYSFWLKRIVLIDVTILAMLYMIRILAGAVIAQVPLSFWFTAVSLFLFLSLALVKRYAELSRHSALGVSESLPGRGYRSSDAAVVLPMGIGAGASVIVLLAVYIQSDVVAVLYPSGGILWLVIPAMFYWIGNLWLQAGRGKMHDDPIVFALSNRPSLVAAAIIVVLFGIASTPLQSIIHNMISTVR
jgi:4-hydroxybenzoate polyprenyltransferase